MGNIERVTSDQMYAEQSWVEQLLKRVRNEADSATNDFHGYLVDQLLTVSTKILAALQNQDKTVQDLSAKLDKNFAGINQRLEEYLADAAKLRSNKMAAEADFFAGLQRRNAALETSFTADLKETEEYVKVRLQNENKLGPYPTELSYLEIERIHRANDEPDQSQSSGGGGLPRR